MKVSFSSLVFSLVISVCLAEQWFDIKSPEDSPRYLEMMNKLHPMTSARDSNDPIRSGRITNGTLAVAGQFPYQVYMYLYELTGASYLCGGSIIHRRWILTAAHCVRDIAKVEVYMGAINRKAFGEVGAYIRAIVVTNRRSIIPHSGWTSTATGNDIGLVELPNDAPIENNFIGILQLPTGTYLTNNFTEEIATVAGFGRYTDSSSSSSLNLNFVQLPIALNEECSNVFNYVRDSNICLRSVDGKSACSGDSGGALTVIDSQGNPLQVGIVSFGSGIGCELGYPNVFVRVTSFMPWIRANTGINF